MNNEVKSKKVTLSKKTLILLCVFSGIVILACGIIFLFNYRSAYSGSTDGGFFSPSDAVKFYFFLISISALIVAVILKIIFKNELRFGYLFLIAILLPILCYNLNYHTLKRGGVFNFLVSDGGPFHFIAIGDYNFDGINDERYHILYDEREISSGYGGHFNDTVIRMIDTTATGVGAALNSVCALYDWEDRIIDLHLHKDSVDLKQIRIDVSLKEPQNAQKISFFILESKYQSESKPGIPISHTVNEDGTVTLLFDSATCTAWQENSEREFITIYIRYVIDE